MKKILFKILYKLLFRIEDKEIDALARFEIFKTMNNNDSIKLLMRSLYTRIFRGLNVNYATSKDTDAYTRGLYAGRLIQQGYILDMMEYSVQNIEKLKQEQKKKAKFGKAAEKVKQGVRYIKKPI